MVEAELAGKGTEAVGFPSRLNALLSWRTGDGLDLIVGVEAVADELQEGVPARQYSGKSYRVWREVENFAESGPGGLCVSGRSYHRDDHFRAGLTICSTFPPAGSEIRLWYRPGGGAQGNVARNTLTLLKDPIPGVSVNNPEAASGGASAENIEDAIRRGPQEFHSVQRAVTARDFEYWARKAGAVSRARAFTKADLWKYATPGTVEIVLVPLLDEQQLGGHISALQLQERQTEQARKQIQQTLDERRPLGTNCIVSWVRYKTVKVQLTIVAYQEEDFGALQKRVLERLHRMINPLPAVGYPGWRFGQALWISNVYDAVRAEPGVSHIELANLIVDEVPARDISCLAVDPFQPDTWYAGTQNVLYRSTDNGDGWEAAGRFENQEVRTIRGHPKRPV